MTRTALRPKLARERAICGFMQTYPHPALTEIAGFCGYDFLVLDTEHGLLDVDDCLRALQTLVATDTLALVRLAGYDTRLIGQYLDMGVDALVISDVASAEQARLLVNAMSYPPAGTRGFGAPAHRGTSYGMDVTAHLSSPREACLFVMIESAAGLANVESIVATEGVDGVIIGPSDLSAHLGHLRDFAQPSFIEAMKRIEQATARAGKLLGTAVHPGAPVEALVARGHRLLILGADTSLIRDSMTAQLSKAKSAI